MKKLVVMLVLCGLAASAVAQEWTEGWTTTVDLSYTTKYIWRGFDVLDDAGAFQPSIDFAHESGFGANLWMSIAGTSGSTQSVSSRADLTEFDYTLYYSGKAYEGACWETDYTVGWRYYDYIKVDSKTTDVQEMFVEVEMPVITGTPVVPHAGIYQMWPSQSGREVNGDVRDYAGTVYVAGFSYALPTEEQLPELPLTFSWDIAYNDGTGGNSIDHDFSHMVWGLQTELTCPMTGAAIVPAVYYQNSFDDSVNKSDEFWASISYSFAF